MTKKTISTKHVVKISSLAFICLLVFLVFLFLGKEKTTVNEKNVFPATIGDFEITIPASGELRSKNSIEIRNLFEGKSEIVELIAEGTEVNPGDILYKLNTDGLEDSIRTAEEQVVIAKDRVETSLATLRVREMEKATEIAQKRLDVELAILDLEAWKEGDLRAEVKRLNLNIETSKKDFERLKKKYNESLELEKKQFVSRDELEQDEISMIRAKSTYEQAVLSKEVYEKYSKIKKERELSSTVERRRELLEQSKKKLEKEIDAKKSNLKANEDSLQTRKDELSELREQMSLAEVRSPSRGIVVYASSFGDRRERDNPIEVGKTLFKNEPVLILPDTSKMVAKVKVNEALSGLVSKGASATISCDAIPNKIFNGEVLSIGVLAESGGWRDPNRREYSVEILIDDTLGLDLKPSMRCQASILIGSIKNSLYVPVQSVQVIDGETCVWVYKNNTVDKRVVSIGKSSELYVEINSGLGEGEYVSLTPPSASPSKNKTK